MPKKFIRLLPYVTVLVGGFVLYLLALHPVFGEHRELLVNIAATFFSVPLLVVFYEALRSFSEKELNKEIFDYAKQQIDREFLYVLGQLRKIVFPAESKENFSKTISVFLSLTSEDLTARLKKTKYIGFQVFKHWKTSEGHVAELLENSFILDKMENDHIILIIEFLKNLKNFERLQASDGLYKDIQQRAAGYSISNNDEKDGTPEIGKQKVLLKFVKKDVYTVCDTGAIAGRHAEKCLNYYKISPEVAEAYAASIFDLLTVINTWLRRTGNEFILETKLIHLDKMM